MNIDTYLMAENVQQALYYIIYSSTFNYYLDPKIDSAFIYDEAHTTMKDKQTIRLLDRFTRRCRKYSNISVLGTQEPIDFDQRETSGILNSTAYIIVKMFPKKNALQKLESMIGMEEDLDRIKSFRQGDSYFK